MPPDQRLGPPPLPLLLVHPQEEAPRPPAGHVRGIFRDRFDPQGKRLVQLFTRLVRATLLVIEDSEETHSCLKKT